MDDYKWGLASVEDLFTTFSTSSQGLTEEEAQKRLTHYGANTVHTSQHTIFTIFLRQIKSPFVYLLLFAALISWFLHDYANAILISIILVVNICLSFIQEYRAEKAVRSLRKYITISARVKRDNKEKLIESSQLVPGDFVILNPGDPVPADIRLIESDNLAVDESALSGESEPRIKNAEPLIQEVSHIYEWTNCVFMGTTVTSGSAKGIVIATGNQTQFGSISALSFATQQHSIFQENISRLSAFIIKLISGAMVIIIAAHILIHGLSTNFTELFLFAIALAVAVTPEALPVVTTWSLSRGALILAKNNVLVKRLSAVEDLGSITVLCADKTGTLTENKLTVIDIFNATTENVLWYAQLATLSQSKTNHSPFSAAFHAQDIDAVTLADYSVIKEIPFDPATRTATTMVQKNDDAPFAILQGAHEAIFAQIPHLDREIQNTSEQWIAQHGMQGNRVIAIAMQRQEHDAHAISFIGLIALTDPLKKSAPYAIKRAQELGVAVKIITGDSKEVSTAIALKVGLISSEKEVLLGDEFAALSSEEKLKAVNNYAVFARITPQQKYEIIEYLKKNNAVGFLGEGINDAPALKTAHVGIVVQGGTDIAKEAGDIILLHKSLAVIIDGIALGRTTFNNTVKYITVCLTSTFGNFYSITIASLILDYLPMLPLQLILVNFMSDLPMISIATDKVDTSELKTPKSYNVRDITLTASFFAAVSSIFDFMLFAHFYHAKPAVLQTSWFIATILAQVLCIFSLRSRYPFYKAARPSLTLIVLSCIMAAITVALPFTSFGQKYLEFVHPTKADIVFIGILVVSYFITNEIMKYIYYRWLRKGTSA